MLRSFHHPNPTNIVCLNAGNDANVQFLDQDDDDDPDNWYDNDMIMICV